MVVAADKNDINLNIRRVKQDKSWSCWYASAQMVLSYRNVTLPATQVATNLSSLVTYYADKGLGGAAVRKFAADVGLNADQSYFAGLWSPAGFSVALGKVGPLWVPGLFPQGARSVGHVVVVAGKVGDALLIADPDGSQPYPKWMDVKSLEQIWGALSLPILYSLPGPVS